MTTKHTPGAVRIAEILIPEGIDHQGRPSRLRTGWGEKTREGLADLIDNETGISRLTEQRDELLAALQTAWNVICWAAQESQGKVGKEIVGGWLDHAARINTAIAKATGSEAAQ